MTIETLIAISVMVIAAIMALAAWIMQERSILSTDSVMNSLNMGTVPRPLLLSLCLFSLLTFSGCATLPRIEDYVPLKADAAPKIIGPNGQLSPKISKAIMEQLKGQVEPTDILQRRTLLIEVISGSLLVTGNKVALLIDAPATYEAMFKAIQSAKDHINLETYIFEDDEVGRRFVDLLLN
jgi:cardiolipin synthase